MSTAIVQNPDDHPSEFSTDWGVVCDDATNTITSLKKPNGTVTTGWSCVLDSEIFCVSTAACDYFGNITTCELPGSNVWRVSNLFIYKPAWFVRRYEVEARICCTQPVTYCFY